MKRDRGFTFMEIMIVSAIVAGIFLVLAAVVRMSQQSLQVQHNTMTVSHELRRGIQEMSRDLAEASANVVSIPADGRWYPTITYQIPQDLDLNGTVLNALGNVEWSQPVTLALGGAGANQVQRTQGGNTRVVSYGVTKLQFRRQALTPQVVEMDLTVQRGATTGGFIQQSNLTSRIRLRNQ